MRRVTVATIALLGSLSTGCVHPARLTVSTTPAAPGKVAFRRTDKSKTAPGNDHCALPCVVEIPPNATYQMTVRAQGYFPATIEMPYLAAGFYVSSNPQGSFVVPLVSRKPH